MYYEVLSLGTFKIPSLSLSFDSITIMCVGMEFFEFILLGIGM